MPRDESKDIVTVMFPMLRKHQVMLREIHTRARQLDPQIIADYRAFAAMTFGALIEKMHEQVMPQPTIMLADRMPTKQPPSVMSPGWKPPQGSVAASLRHG